jgi:DNA-directed RNA polymerase subunit RPC12/RpoP
VRKADLLNMESLNATDKMFEMASREPKMFKSYYGTEKVYDYYWFLKAKVIKVKDCEVLKISLFARKDLEKGCTEARFQIFLSKDENKYITYDTHEEKWKTARIYSLDNPEYSYVYQVGKWYDQGTDDIIVNYLENPKKTPFEAVKYFQDGIANENLRRTHKKITDKIDAAMELIPELPKDFNSWIENTAMIHSRYIYYNYSRNVKEGYCTHCGKMVSVTKPKHNAEGVCSSCKSKITFKAIKKAAVVRDEGYAAIYQKTKEGYGLRYFEIYKNYDDFMKPITRVYELVRCLYDKNLYSQGTYDYREFKNTGVTRWCVWEDCSYNYYGWSGKSIRIRATTLYDKNIQFVFKGTDYQYSCIDKFAKGLKGGRFYPGEYMQQYKKRPYMEYLVKLKLFNLVKDLLTGYSGTELNSKGRRIHEVLKVTKEQVRDLIKMNASLKELRTLQEANKAGVKLTNDQIHWLTQNNATRFIKYMTTFTPHKIIKYLNSQGAKVSDILNEYDDYLDFSVKLGTILNDFTFFPKDLKKAHDKAATEWQQELDRIKEMKDEDRNVLMITLAEEYVKEYGMKDKHFSIRIPWTCKEIKDEGAKLHHCVGTYLDYVLQKECVILFIRNLNDINTPFYTMEVKGNEVIQVRGKNNCSMTPEVSAFVEKFKRKKLYQRIEKEAV